MKISRFVPLLVLSALLSMTACYSFSGASIPLGAKTLTIEYFPNKASLVNPSLSSNLTESLRSFISSRANLNEVDEGGDLEISGEIVDYRVEIAGIQNDATASLNKLTLVVKVNYSNHINPKDNFSQNFSRYKEFDSALDLSSVEDALVTELIKEIVDDIFTRAFSNW